MQRLRRLAAQGESIIDPLWDVTQSAQMAPPMLQKSALDCRGH